MAASYPGSVKTFTSRNNGDVIQASHVNDLQDEVNAVESGLINSLSHDLKFTDATYDIGKSGATRPRDLFISRNATIGGTVTVTGGQVAFPATQAASTDANTLDDYEEGTFTPTIGGTGGQSGQVYSLQFGSYVKIGKLVFATYNVTLSTLGTITGTAQIQGLPFTIENTASYVPGGALAFWGSMTSNFVYIAATGVINTTAASLFGATAAAASLSAVVQANLSATTNLEGTIVYRASA